MKHLKFLVTGVLFGIILTKSEVISWYRIYEMFRFESFHMYGVIGSAVLLGVVITRVIKYFKVKDITGSPITMVPKERAIIKPLLGGTIFGLGWALTGACPGPIYILIGNGYFAFFAVLLSAILGTFVYGMVMNKLPQR